MKGVGERGAWKRATYPVGRLAGTNFTDQTKQTHSLEQVDAQEGESEGGSVIVEPLEAGGSSLTLNLSSLQSG